MDNLFHQQESGTQQTGRFFVNLQIFDGVLRWLASLIQLTEEEQEDAGIYLGGQSDK